MQILYAIFVAIVFALLVYLRYYSGIEGFQAEPSAPSPTCPDEFIPDGKGSCVGYVCVNGPDKKKQDGTNTCVEGTKTVPAVLTKHSMMCPQGYIVVTPTTGASTCVKI